MKKERSILGVFAHPDDEAYGPGGTLARYALDRVPVHVLTFTGGEAGSIGVSKEIDPEDLRRRRRIELTRACDSLGAAGCRVVGTPDGEVGRMSFEEGVREVVEEIESRNPAVLITFHGKGVSGHPDHIAVTGMTREAFRRTGRDGPSKLYEWAIPQSRAALYRERTIYPAPDEDIGAVIEVPAAAMDRKLEAIRAHETQIEFYRQLIRMTGDYPAATSLEYFVLADTRLPRPERIENDLFEGLP